MMGLMHTTPVSEVREGTRTWDLHVAVTDLDRHAEPWNFVRFHWVLLPTGLAGGGRRQSSSANPFPPYFCCLQFSQKILGLFVDFNTTIEEWGSLNLCSGCWIKRWYIWPSEACAQLSRWQVEKWCGGHWQECGPRVGSLGWTSCFIT